MLKDHAYIYNIPLPKEIMPNYRPIYRNPCKKCIVQACCTRSCRNKYLYETTIYWGKVKFKQIISKPITIGIIVFIITATIWGFR